MRIVLDLQACQASSRHRGIGRYSLSLAQAIARHGGEHDIRIVLNRQFPGSFEQLALAFDGLIAPERISAFDVPVSVDGCNPANAWRVRAAERIREAYLAQLAPDIVHVSSLFEGLGEDAVVSVGAFTPASGFDTAVTLYDLIPLLRKETYLTSPAVTNWYFRKLQSLKNSELLLAISGHTRREALSALHLPEQKIVNISSAIDPIFHRQTLTTDQRDALASRYRLKRPFVMYTGGIDYRKNIEGLIDAFARLPEALRKQYQLAIVCNVQTIDRTRLEALARQRGLADDELVLTGFVPDADLVELYNTTTLFVFPSLQEGFGLPALEAMACGAATIGSDTSSIPEVIGRADALFDPNDIDAIRDKMHQALTRDDFRASLQAHGLQQATLFSWEASAKTALAAFEDVHARRQQQTLVPVALARQTVKPRLAFFSPLPPAQSGIADYSAELLPELARHYDIDVVVAQDQISDPWIDANYPVRSTAWFEQNATRFARVLYHFGNSAFHGHMFDTLLRHPGVVVLHDFYLSGIVNYLERDASWPNAFCRSLYESHGYPALLDELRDGRTPAIYRFPCNKPVLDNAAGIIVHSQYSMRLARQWYGPAAADGWRYIPLLKAEPALLDHAAARALLGFSADDFLVCSFGHVGATKLNDRLIDVWRNSPLAADPRCHLVFVGAVGPDEYGIRIHEMVDTIAHDGRIRITGFATPEIYRAYLSCADIAVQLRSQSRGETSAAILDCLSYGIATIVNANGSAAELPDDVLVKLPDDFSQGDLFDALITLWGDTERRQVLVEVASRHVRIAHEPARIGDAYYDAIEQFACSGPLAASHTLFDSIAAVSTAAEPSVGDLEQVAASVRFNLPAPAPWQLLIDVTAWHADPVATHRQQFAHHLRELILAPPPGFRVEPFYVVEGTPRYARHFTLELLGRPELVLDDAALDIRRGDCIVCFNRAGSLNQAVTTVAGSPALITITESADRGGTQESHPLGAFVNACLIGLLADAALTADEHTEADERLAVADSTDQIDAVAIPDIEMASDAVVRSSGSMHDQVVLTASGDGLANGATPRSSIRQAAFFRQPAQTDRSTPQLLVDITMLIKADDKSGIQRVVRSILNALLENPPVGCTVMPVYDAGGYYAYANAFLRAGAATPASGNPESDDTPIHLNAGDRFLGLDLSPHNIPRNKALFDNFRLHGVDIYFVVYDLLPVLHPEVFVPGASPWFTEWLDAVSGIADGLICISRAVADDMLMWVRQAHPQRLERVHIGYFHLGADINASLPTIGMNEGDAEVLRRATVRPSFLMVGTLEPRKSHTQALYAIELLWAAGIDVNLVIVGKQGWMVEALVEKLRHHHELGKRLFWLERISDEMLLHLYGDCSALIAASIGEGFGLPLIEAAIHGLPIIARELPVFREVCGDHAFYFNGDTATLLADALQSWLTLDQAGVAPQSNNLPWLTWSQSALQLMQVIDGQIWHHAPAKASGIVARN